MVVIRYLLSIVEVCSILLILILSRLQLVLQSAEVILAEFSLLHSLESFVQRRLLAFIVLTVNGCAGCLSE